MSKYNNIPIRRNSCLVVLFLIFSKSKKFLQKREKGVFCFEIGKSPWNNLRTIYVRNAGMVKYFKNPVYKGLLRTITVCFCRTTHVESTRKSNLFQTVFDWSFVIFNKHRVIYYYMHFQSPTLIINNNTITVLTTKTQINENTIGYQIHILYIIYKQNWICQK